ncbi:MAG TPA: hypothetical protein VGH99_02050 [Pseudonocardia sp.]|jgi:hypothetical protein
MGIEPTAAEARRVLDHAVRAAAEEFGPALSAAFALGSLAHGGFAPLVSDVDLALVLDPVGDASSAAVARVAERSRGELAGPLAARLSIFWADWAGVRHGVPPGTPGRLPAVDRLDLLDAGRLLHGTDHRHPAEPPDAAELVRDSAEFVRDRFDAGYLARLHDPDALLADGVRPVTKAVLFPVRFLFTLSRGQIGHNSAAAAWYVRAGRPGGGLVGAALGWRDTGIGDPAAARRLLADGLPALYRELLDDYAAAMRESGAGDLADALARRSQVLGRLGAAG